MIDLKYLDSKFTEIYKKIDSIKQDDNDFELKKGLAKKAVTDCERTIHRQFFLLEQKLQDKTP